MILNSSSWPTASSRTASPARRCWGPTPCAFSGRTDPLSVRKSALSSCAGRPAKGEKMVFIETERLVLRNTAAKDADSMFDYRSSEICAKYQRGQTKELDGIRRLIEHPPKRCDLCGRPVYAVGRAEAVRRDDRRDRGHARGWRHFHGIHVPLPLPSPGLCIRGPDRAHGSASQKIPVMGVCLLYRTGKCAQHGIIEKIGL